VLYIGPGWGYGGGPRRGVGRCGLPLTRGRGGPSCYSRSPISCPWSGSHCDPTEILEFVRLAVFWAMRVGRRVLWVRWKDLFQTLPMVPGSSGVSQRFLCCGHGKLELACNQGTVRRNRFTESLGVRLEVGCLGRLRACFKAVLKAHPTVYRWLIGSRVGVSSVGLKRAGSADPMEEMAAGALRGLVCVFFVCCWCLAPKNALRHLRTTQDVRRRSVRG